MIKFFRKIRQNLLSENKFSKYLIYAIGEIVLVVIGILIALSINNWNEQRKNSFKEISVLIEIRSDLKTNAERLKQCYQYDSLSVNSFDFIINHLENKKPYQDSLKYHIPELIEWCAYEVVASTYSNLKQTLGVDLISDSGIRKNIINLYERGYPQATKNIEQDEMNVHISLMLPKFSKLFLIQEENNGNDTEVKVAIPVDYQVLLNDNEFLTNLKIIRGKRNWSADFDKILYGKTVSVINEITVFLNNN